MSLGLVFSDSSTGVIPGLKGSALLMPSSHSRHLCSPSPLLLRNQELQMWAGKTGKLAVREKGCRFSWVKYSPPFLSFEMTKTSVAARVKPLIFHPMVRVRLVRAARREIYAPVRHLLPTKPVEAVAVQKMPSLPLAGNKITGQQRRKCFRSSCRLW